MAPYTAVTTITEDICRLQPDVSKSTEENPERVFKTIIGTYKEELKWVNLISIGIMHAVLFWGLAVFSYINNPKLIAWGFLIGSANGLGVTAGAHRLWCHRSYKATLPLRIFLMLCFTMSGQNSLFDWVRDHRIHHRYTETDADPHNSKRGFFFAHVGWLMMKKHPEVIRRGKEVDMSDLLADPVVKFHQKYFIPLKILLCFILPTIVPPLWWGQDWTWAILAMCVGRYAISLNFTWFVNSAAHLWGTRPYDKGISPRENLTVSILAMGEGWHNYHHTFPWDYKTSELWKYSVNLTAFWIDVFAKLGLAYDLKTPSKELIKRVVEKSGDGSHDEWGHFEVPESAEESIKTEELFKTTNLNNNLKDR